MVRLTRPKGPFSPGAAVVSCLQVLPRTTENRAAELHDGAEQARVAPAKNNRNKLKQVTATDRYM